MYELDRNALHQAVVDNVKAALAEDVGTGDINAELIPETTHASARIIVREDAVLCGRLWVDEAFRQLDDRVMCRWHAEDGERVSADSTVAELHGPGRSLLSGERVALNFLQMLSSTATRCAYLMERIRDTDAQLLDTRKTLPGLRLAQKYAMRCGGGASHRMGLYDAYLIKENHIAACGSIRQAVDLARQQHPDRRVEVEVENLDELEQALAAEADVIMLDNFDLATTRKAVRLVAGRVPLEASGGVNEQTLHAIAETGVDYISLGTLTKDIQAIDLSMRLTSVTS